MSIKEEKTLVEIICPYCKEAFKKEIETSKKKNGLYSILIKNHSNSQNCSAFIAFIDEHGWHRGSQKIDNIDEDKAVNDKVVESARERINELENTLRFYHLRVPRRESRGFEYKVANVQDRAFMSSKLYITLIDFLAENDEKNIFGVLRIEENRDFEGGLLVYGKYLGMIYTLYWSDQKFIESKSIDDLKGYANLTVEKLLDIYDLMDYFL
jgi:hypothetical protein